jgi:hypothetical protein
MRKDKKSRAGMRQLKQQFEAAEGRIPGQNYGSNEQK